MPKDHLALAIGQTYLTMLVDWIESILLCACHAVLVPECESTTSATTPEHIACPEWPSPNHFDFYATQ